MSTATVSPYPSPRPRPPKPLPTPPRRLSSHNTEPHHQILQAQKRTSWSTLKKRLSITSLRSTDPFIDSLEDDIPSLPTAQPNHPRASLISLSQTLCKLTKRLSVPNVNSVPNFGAPDVKLAPAETHHKTAVLHTHFNNHSQALTYYTFAANLHYPPSMNNLGVCYANGLGVSPNVQRALEWISRAAENGYAVAYWNMGVLLSRDGREEEAREWFVKAMEMGVNSGAPDGY